MGNVRIVFWTGLNLNHSGDKYRNLILWLCSNQNYIHLPQSGPTLLALKTTLHSSSLLPSPQSQSQLSVLWMRWVCLNKFFVKWTDSIQSINFYYFFNIKNCIFWSFCWPFFPILLIRFFFFLILGSILNICSFSFRVWGVECGVK